MNGFIDHASMISGKRKYPFIIANTDASDKASVHWWSVLDIEPRTDLFFFDFSGLDGLKHFIVQNTNQLLIKFY